MKRSVPHVLPDPSRSSSTNRQPPEAPPTEAHTTKVQPAAHRSAPRSASVDRRRLLSNAAYRFSPALRLTAAALAVFALWAVAAAGINRPVLPGPLEALTAMTADSMNGQLLRHLAISVLRALAAIGTAFAPALVLGIAAGLSRAVDGMLSPTAYLLSPVPKTALLPVILLFLGLGNASKIFLVALIVFFPFYLAIRDETRGIDKSWYDSLASLGGTRLAALFHVTLPAILPRIWSTLRTSAGTAFSVLFLAETFATREGIGWYIMDAWTRLEYAQMYGGIIALALAGLAITVTIDGAEKLTCPWASNNRHKEDSGSDDE